MAALHELIYFGESKELNDFYMSVFSEENQEIEVFADLVKNRKKNRMEIEDYDPYFID